MGSLGVRELDQCGEAKWFYCMQTGLQMALTKLFGVGGRAPSGCSSSVLAHYYLEERMANAGVILRHGPRVGR